MKTNFNRRRFLCMTAGTGSLLGLAITRGHFKTAVNRTMALRRRRNSNAAPAMKASEGHRTDCAARSRNASRSGDDRSHEEARGADLVVTTRTSWALGTDVSITVIDADPAMARVAIDASFDALEIVEDLMSIYRPASQMCRLNRDRMVETPHPQLVEVLRASQRLSRLSGGAFDLTVEPLWAAYQDAKDQKRLPTAGEIESARAKVNWRQVEVSSRRVALHGKESAVTLNGIAQGYAADRVMSVLQSHGIEHALIDTGELIAIGQNAQADAWSVGIQHPRDQGAYVAIAELDGRCLATSGDYATTFSDDRAANHLFDPRTGRSPSELASVSVVAPSGILADGLSTAVFVMGAEKGLDLIRATPKADALFVLKNGRILQTDRFPRTVSPVDLGEIS